MGVATMRIARRVFLVSSLLLLLVACKSARQRISEMDRQIPIPQDSILLSSMISESQGSEDACYFTSLVKLYGSSMQFSYVEDFYVRQLTSQGWVQIFPIWLPKELPYFRHANTYQLALSNITMDDLAIEQFEDVKQEDLESYPTLYSFTLVYADPIARMKCSAWNSSEQ
jgi:hypothetical protein